MNNKRIISIECFRFCLIIQICLWHYGKCLGLMSNGYVAVEFFFILSGYLLYESYHKAFSKSTLDYTITKVKRFLPKIVLAFLLFGFTFHAIILEYPLCIVNDLSLLSGVGLVDGLCINSPLWYISVLVLGGGLLYSMLKNWGHISISIVFPLIILFVYSFIVQNHENNLECWTTEFCFHMPFWRGMAGMCLGCILAYVQRKKKNQIETKYRKILDILSVLALIGYSIFVFLRQHYDIYVVICCSILIVVCFSQTSMINRIITQKFWVILGNISFDMLILHWYILRFMFKLENMDILIKNDLYNILLYIPILLIVSFLFNFTYQAKIKPFLDKYI